MRAIRNLGSLLLIAAFAAGCSDEPFNLPTDITDGGDLLPRPFTTIRTSAVPPVASHRSDLSPPGATVITFEGFACFTQITNQFAGLGVTFTSGAQILVAGHA